MKHFFAIVFFFFAAVAFGCFTPDPGAYVYRWTTGAGYNTISIESDLFDNSQVVVLAGERGTPESGVVLISLPSPLMLQVPSRFVYARVQFRRLAANGSSWGDSGWTDIKLINAPSWNTVPGRPVSYFGKYPLSEAGLKVQPGNYFYVRICLKEASDATGTVNLNQNNVEANNPWYIKFKVDVNRRPH